MAGWYLCPWSATKKTALTQLKHSTHEEPSLEAGTVPTVLPDPTEMQARLYEVMPYPRVPRYFRRHWW